MSQKRQDSTNLFDILTVVSVTIVALLLIVLFKVKAGILGIGLGAIAVGTLIYWLKEAKKIFREEKDYLKVKGTLEKQTGDAEWYYDLTYEGDSMTLTAEVPGPADQVNVKLHKGVLEITSGRNFTRQVSVSPEVQIHDQSYMNGVLRVRLRKVTKTDI